VKELKGFARVQLNPGETRRVSIALDRRAFAYFNVYVGGSSARGELAGTITTPGR
jgi:beta-glucosidase